MVDLAQLGIVVPALDAAATIGTTLECLRPAAAAGARVVVIDGGSTDDTVARTSPFPVDCHFVAGTMYEAINAGCRMLDVEWLTWINADDILHGDRLAPRIAAAGSDDGVLYGPVDFIDACGRFVHAWRSARPADLLPLYRAGYSPLLQQGTLFRRRVFEAVGGFDAGYRYVADADFWWRALEAGHRFRAAPTPPVAAFRLHAAQQSQRHRAEMHEEHRRMVAAQGARPRAWSGLVPLARWRLGNATNYVVRGLRRGGLTGRPGLAGSYSIPAAG
jgi:glycosyltransferase involved in cell wall biosynthesis